MESIETDYSGYKECGHPEYRKTSDGPQPNDCGCVGDNYAEASAAHAAINTTDLADPYKNIPNADDSLNGEFSPAKTEPRAWTATDTEINWESLRIILADDTARWRKLSDHKHDYWAGRADAAQAVLESMTTLERYQVPGLAEHTQAACDTITKAACDTIKASADPDPRDADFIGGYRPGLDDA